jgi:hypothetical protein
MVKTLNNDSFKGEPDIKTVDAREPHVIVYGSKGWTDGIDDATLDLLVRAGVLRFVRAVEGADFETRLYESVKGSAP